MDLKTWQTIKAEVQAAPVEAFRHVRRIERIDPKTGQPRLIAIARTTDLAFHVEFDISQAIGEASDDAWVAEQSEMGFAGLTEDIHVADLVRDNPDLDRALSHCDDPDESLDDDLDEEEDEDARAAPKPAAKIAAENLCVVTHVQLDTVWPWLHAAKSRYVAWMTRMGYQVEPAA